MFERIGMNEVYQQMCRKSLLKLNLLLVWRFYNFVVKKKIKAGEINCIFSERKKYFISEANFQMRKMKEMGKTG